MIDRAKSEALMLTREAGYIEEIKQIPGTSPEVLAAMSALYRAGWRDCWEAEAVNAWDDEVNQAIRELSSSEAARANKPH